LHSPWWPSMNLTLYLDNAAAQALGVTMTRMPDDLFKSLHRRSTRLAGYDYGSNGAYVLRLFQNDVGCQRFQLPCPPLFKHEKIPRAPDARAAGHAQDKSPAQPAKLAHRRP
jgi:hypothetical protein